ncbi:O-antigen ligase family protein [Chlorogloea sp. CCALA 695]|uniref:O-antigen ligase family protein n=1 Tax=Chlorogloea sp. CCALA 695 TaxID=2107693 RepID=UPI000D068962|nr:hypothetical protein [Chlorogloea sp. CCALA 695]PSB32744.1 hypothetical protein C7B70_09465 [Chlorogloea sp. CCALA 695]
MQLSFEDNLLRFAIYLLPFSAFALQQEGLGFIQLPLPIILFVLTLFVFLKGIQGKLVLGNTSSVYTIVIFFSLALASTILSFLVDETYSLYKSIGVLVSLIILIAVYYTVSAVNRNPYKSHIFFNDYIKISIFASAMVIIEFGITTILHHNYLHEFLKSITAQIPYNTPLLADLASDDRYRGIMVEPRELGSFTLPVFASIMSVVFINKNFRIYNYLILLLIIAANILTKSVTNYFLMIIIAGFFIIKRKSNSGKSLSIVNVFIIILSGAMIIASTIVLLIQFQDYLDPIVQNRLKYLVEFAQTGYYDNDSNLSVQVILNAYNSAIYSLQKNPLLGVGLGNISQSYESAALARGIETRLNQHDGYSMLFRLLTEVGILGTVGFLSIFWSRINQSLKLVNWFGRYAFEATKSNRYNEVYQEILKINSAALASLLYALLNQPTYWNLVVPLLFGLCFKINFAKLDRSIQEEF